MHCLPEQARRSRVVGSGEPATAGFGTPDCCRLTRRGFLFSGAAAFAVNAVVPARRAVVIGHTGRGDYGHGLEAIFAGRPGIELVALADPVEAARERRVRETGALRAYADWRELLERERPDLVSIAMRHADQHADVALACLRAGAHCYVEKPFVMTCEEADAVLAEADRCGRRVAVAHTMRMSPAVRRLREWVAGGGIGELREMQAFGKQAHRAGGEDLSVLGTHLFDLMRLCAGDPLWVAARIMTSGRDITVADRRRVKDEVGWVAGDTVRAQFAFADGVQGLFTSDGALREITGDWGIELRGSRGVARLKCDLVPSVFTRTSPPWSTGDGSEVWTPLDGVGPMEATDHNRAPVEDWLDAIATGREPECSARNGAWAIEMVSGCYQSALGAGRVGFPLQVRAGPLGAI